jgi:voltage-dependent calcium channel
VHLGHTKQLSSGSARFAPGQSLGDDLNIAEEGMSTSMGKGDGTLPQSGSLAKETPSRSGSQSKSRSLSPGASPVRRVSVAVQNMSQRVVNISNDPEAVEQAMRRTNSIKSGRDRNSIPSIKIQSHDELSDPKTKPITPLGRATQPQKSEPWHIQSNPLRGNTMRIFSPTNPLRLFLCDILIHP